jgi:predicted flap endonuclease-1-like 5' DNA nuclease
MANMKIEDIEGIGPAYGDKLRAAGVADTDTLLKKCKTPADRKTLAEKTGIDGKTLLRWANMADLFRISGVGSEYSELLEAAGVDTVKELKTRVPGNLATRMIEVNEKKKLTRRVPTEKVIAEWVEQAKKLPAAIEY